MMSLTPFLPPAAGEASAIFSLLQVIGDPKAAKAVMDKMAEHQKAIENATAKQEEQFKLHSETLQKERAENDKLKRTADTVASKAAAELGTAKTILAEAERRKAETQHIERITAEQRVDLEQLQIHVKTLETDAKARLHELTQREGAMARAEQKLNNREADLAMREKTLADDIAEHNKWLAGLKPPRAR